MKKERVNRELYLNLSYVENALKKEKQSNLTEDYYTISTLYALLCQEDSAFIYLQKSLEYKNSVEVCKDYFFDTYKKSKKWATLFRRVSDLFYTQSKNLSQASLALRLILLSGREQSMSYYAQYYDKVDTNYYIEFKKNKEEVKRTLDDLAKREYPLLSEIGYDATKSLFLLLQHSDDIPLQKNFLSKMKTAAKDTPTAKIINPFIAYLEDRILVNEKKKQIYGTQIFYNNITGQPELFPIINPNDVNSVRKKMGLNSLEEYMKSFIYNGADSK